MIARISRFATHAGMIAAALGMLHLIQQAIAGWVQCSTLGCLPAGATPW